jgi:hypothetical protein
MIRQLGPLTFFVTFTTSVNNWPMHSNTLKELYEKHVTTNQTNNNVNYTLSIREVRNDHVTCTHYYEHRMNRFHILLKTTNMLFGKINDFFSHWISNMWITL